LTKAPKLPATTLASRCYDNMFDGCTNLIEAPELPATTLASHCYYRMFDGCTNLTVAPKLPATTLASNCYEGMFLECTNLSEAPELPATTLASHCYYLMFYECTNLTVAPKLPAITLVSNCYNSMFFGCTNLIEVPELPAAELKEGCYNSMFRDCLNLNCIKVHFKDWNLPFETTSHWVYNVADSGTFVCPKDLPIEFHDKSKIPEGWTIKYIEEITGVDLINEKLEETANVWTDKNSKTIFVTKTKAIINVYNLSGMLLKCILPKNETVTKIPMKENGIYIVQIGNKKRKVAL
jgi:hypothetical protein